MDTELNTATPRPKFPTLSSTVGIVILLLVASAVVGGILALLMPSNKPVLLFLAYVIPFGIVTTVLLMMQKHDFGATFSSLFKRFDIQIIPFLFLFVLGFGYVSDIITSLIPMPDWIKRYFEDMVQVSTWSFLTVCIAAPVLEELLCRGVLLRSYLQNYTVRKALFWSAFIFAILHLNPWQAIPAFGIGYFMAWLFFKTSSILPAITVHFLNNFIAFVSSYYFGANYEITKEVSWQLNAVFFLVGVVLSLYSVFRIKRILQQDK